jgi:hypothetical protein
VRPGFQPNFPSSSLTGFGNLTVTAGSKNIGTLIASSISISSGAMLTSDVILNGALTVNGTFAIRPGNLKASAVSAATIAGATNAWPGKIDLTDGALVVTPFQNSATVLATVKNQVLAGFHNGDWLGKGITSSTAAADPAHYTVLVIDATYWSSLFFRDATLTDNSIIVATARFGDATLDGKVDAFDLNVLAAHWQQQSSALWIAGDFTGDGKVDAFDLNALAANWQGNSSLEAALALSPIPEPSSVSLAGLTVTALLIRRRRT